jgi:segregation and condensation protein A
MKPDLTLVPSSPAPAPPKAPALHSQTEMPFAVVEGQPVVELPRDLYIPPQALEVFLEAFEGPLDLLLYLIRRQNLDILDIPIAEITRQYTRYIELMQVLQLELAGEYLLMAATLAEIKSRMLLPRVHSAEAGDETDPRAELVRRLQEYERFKRAAERMDQIPRLDRDTWVASAELVDRKVVRIPPQVTLQEMLLAFQDVLARSDMFAHHHVQREPLSVRQRMSDVLASLDSSAFVDFVKLFRPDEGRRGVTVTFMAILELLREGLIEIVQSEAYAPLHVRRGNPARHLKLVADDEAAANDIDAAADAPGGAAAANDDLARSQ